jgi:hypothetical protein
MSAAHAVQCTSQAACVALATDSSRAIGGYKTKSNVFTTTSLLTNNIKFTHRSNGPDNAVLLVTASFDWAASGCCWRRCRAGRRRGGGRRCWRCRRRLCGRYGWCAQLRPTPCVQCWGRGRCLRRQLCRARGGRQCWGRSWRRGRAQRRRCRRAGSG